MATNKPPRRRARSYTSLVHKPNGVIHPRVQKVGPEHFAIVSVNPAKCRSKWMMADFYGTVLIDPAQLEHNAKGFQEAIEAIRRQIHISQIKDIIVVIERTGKFHHPAKRARLGRGLRGPRHPSVHDQAVSPTGTPRPEDR